MKNLTISLTKKEFLFGWMYLIFQLLLLPTLLALVNLQLGSPMDTAGLNFVYFLANFLAISVIFHSFLGRSLKQLVKFPGKILSTAVIGCIVYWFLNFLVAIVIFAVRPQFDNVNDSNIAGMAQSSFWLIALGTVVLVPLAEETLFRGLLFGCLYQRSSTAGYLLSTAAFCVIHVIGYIGMYPWDTLLLCFVTYIPAGLCLSWAYARTDCIFTPILMHTLINAVSVAALR